MDVSLASHTHQIPHVGFPQRDPVDTDIIEKVRPIGARLLEIKETYFILNMMLKRENTPINPKNRIDMNEAGTCKYIILTDSP